MLKNNGPDRLNGKERLKVAMSREDFLGGSHIASFPDQVADHPHTDLEVHTSEDILALYQEATTKTLSNICDAVIWMPGRPPPGPIVIDGAHRVLSLLSCFGPTVDLDRPMPEMVVVSFRTWFRGDARTIVHSTNVSVALRMGL